MVMKRYISAQIKKIHDSDKLYCEVHKALHDKNSKCELCLIEDDLSKCETRKS